MKTQQAVFPLPLCPCCRAAPSTGAPVSESAAGIGCDFGELFQRLLQSGILKAAKHDFLREEEC